MPKTEDTKKPGYRIDSEDQARNWILELVEAVEQMRMLANLAPDTQTQRENYGKLLMRQGSALGALMALHRVGMIGDTMFDEMQKRVLAALATQTVIL